MRNKSALVEVLAEQCATCIFRPGNLMRLRPGRVASMVAECRDRETFIPCHETLTYDDDEKSTGPICRGFYDAHGSHALVVRIGKALGSVAFVEAPDA